MFKDSWNYLFNSDFRNATSSSLVQEGWLSTDQTTFPTGDSNWITWWYTYRNISNSLYSASIIEFQWIIYLTGSGSHTGNAIRIIIANSSTKNESTFYFPFEARFMYDWAVDFGGDSSWFWWPWTWSISTGSISFTININLNNNLLTFTSAAYPTSRTYTFSSSIANAIQSCEYIQIYWNTVEVSELSLSVS